MRLTSNGIIESLLGKVASLIWGVQDLVIENGEVEGKTKANWVCWCKVGLSDFGCVLVSLEGLIGRLLSLVANGELGEVTVVITLPAILLAKVLVQNRVPEMPNYIHLVVEDLGFTALGGRNQVLVQNLEDIFADLGKLGLNLLTVLLDEGDLG